MFQFPRFASPHNGDNGIKPLGCPIRKSTGQRIFAPHRGLSQLITSFIASVSQGIHHAPLTTFFRLYNYPDTDNTLKKVQQQHWIIATYVWLCLNTLRESFQTREISTLLI